MSFYDSLKMKDENDIKKNKTRIQKDLTYSPDVQLSIQEIINLKDNYLLNTYDQMPYVFPLGSGEFLYDQENNEYIDFLSGIAVTSLGHANPDLIQTITNQAEKVWHTSNLFLNTEQVQLARALIQITFPGKVFFCNSGTEANEAALKVIRQHGYQYKKSKVISLENSFHGRSFGSMSITGQEKVRFPYESLLQDILFIEANSLDELYAAFDDDIAGIIMEPILGEGGIIPLSVEFLNLARELCDKHHSLFALDEIQTGIGRTGKYFYYQHFNIQPDILTIAKGLGGGFPIGAVIVSDQHTHLLSPGSHGTTFGGNHLACAVAYEVIRSIEYHQLLDNVQKTSNYLYSLLQELQKQFPNIIKQIQGIGLMLGISLREDIDARSLIPIGLEEKIIFGRAGQNVIRLTPPLIVREVTIKRFCEKFKIVLSKLN